MEMKTKKKKQQKIKKKKTGVGRSIKIHEFLCVIDAGETISQMVMPLGVTRNTAKSPSTMRQEKKVEAIP